MVTVSLASRGNLTFFIAEIEFSSISASKRTDVRGVTPSIFEVISSILSCCKSLILKLSISLADVLKAKQFASKKADNSVDTSFCRFITTFFLSLIIYHAPKMLPVVEISILSISNSSIGKISAFSLDETAIPMISPSNTAMNKGRSPFFFF